MSMSMSIGPRMRVRRPRPRPARVTGFMTTWGDGTFTVYRDLDPQGRLVRIGVVFDDGEDDDDDDDDDESN